MYDYEDFYEDFYLENGYVPGADRGNGWDDRRGMSVNAASAYDVGEMPISKWTKQTIINRINNMIEEDELTPGFTAATLPHYTKSQLVSAFLTYAGWHHTSSAFNRTDFYGITDSTIESITDEYLTSLPRPEKHKTTPEQNMYVTARVNYKISRKGRHGTWHTEWIENEIVHYMSNDKMVATRNGNKRLSSLYIMDSCEQKTCYPKAEKVQRGM